MGSIVTFYSFKGGVGRTMAVANVGCLLARTRRVLLVDWDLEAPGLHRYFAGYPQKEAVRQGGLIGLLQEMSRSPSVHPELYTTSISLPEAKLSLLSSGIGASDYESSVLNFDWSEFFETQRGAERLEQLRAAWREQFDVVLIDSRTGITDAGGVCTIFLPDILVLVFTPNAQSLEGAVDVAQRAQRGRQRLHFDRRRLVVIPVPSRFDSRTEQVEAERWLGRFEVQLAAFYEDWLPKGVSARDVLDRTKLPHVSYFSFGEKLPVVTHSLRDPELPGFYYSNLAALIAGGCNQNSVRQALGQRPSFIAAATRIFISSVTSEFGSYAIELAERFRRPNVSVTVPEDFIIEGASILETLDDYIRRSDAVVHLAGDAVGATVPLPAIAMILARYPALAERLPFLRELLDPTRLAVSASTTHPPHALSCTQWEAYLAVYHQKPLFICVPTPGARRGPHFERDAAQQAAQQAHLTRLRALGHHTEITFDSPEALVTELLRSHLRDSLTAGRPDSLPYPSLGTLFKGREQIIAQLRQKLDHLAATGHQAIVAGSIHGLGGIGKTRLAVEYAWRYVDDYTAILFVAAESPAALRHGLSVLTGPLVLDLPEQEAPEEETRVAAALAWLQVHPGWLLILDGVDTPEAASAVEALVSHLAGGQVLITSRLSQWSGSIAPLQLDVLDPIDSVAFLLERTDRRRHKLPTDAEDAAELARQLDGLALALEQAGAFIVANRTSIGNYLAEWMKHDISAQEWHDQRLMQYPRSVAATWQTTMDCLGPSETAMLQLLAWLAPEPVPLFVLEGEKAEAIWREGIALLTPDSQPGQLRRSVARLADYSMIQWDPEAETISVHRVVQEIIRARLAKEERRRWLTLLLHMLDAARPGDPQDVRTWGRWNLLRPHIAYAATEGDHAGISEPTASLMNELGLLLVAKALHAEAEPFFRRALVIDEQTYGPDHPQVARGLNNLASILWDTNRLSEAEPLLHRVVIIFETSFGAEHPYVATALNNLGSLLQTTNRLAEAEPLFRRALAIDEQTYGPDHPSVAIRLNNLASLLQATNRLEEAEPLFRRALVVDEQTYGPDHPQVARGLNNLASLLWDTNRLAEAEPLLHRVLIIFETSFGAEHPYVARGLNNLGSLLQATNRLAEAEPLFRRALAIDEQTYGPDHPSVAIRLNNLASLLQATNRLEEAEPLFRRALVVDEQSYGADHPQVARGLNNLGSLLQATNRLEEAEPLFRRALAIDEQSYGPDHPNVAISLNNLGSLLQATNRLAKAEPFFRRALSIFGNFTRRTGHEHPHLDAALRNYVGIMEALGRTDSQVRAEIEALLG